MNKRNVIVSMVISIIIILLMIIPNEVKAVTTPTTLTPPLYFGIREYRTTDTESLGYAIKNPYDNGSTPESIVGAKIWEIVKHTSSDGSGTGTPGNYYCVRAGVGFSDTNKIATYNISYDFKADKDIIATSGNEWLQKIVTNGYYNNLLALTDLLYLPGKSTITERTELLRAAGINTNAYDYEITNSDIEAVQQAAIWYYTNHDDVVFNNVYNNYDENFTSGNAPLTKTSWLFYRTPEMEKDGEKYKSFSDYNAERNSYGGQEGKDRQEQATYLYNYLIKTANENASGYENGTAISKTRVTLYANATEHNTQPLIEIEKVPEVPGYYGLVLVKQDENGVQLNSQATFQVNNETKEVTGRLTVAQNVEISSSNVGIQDVYTIKEITPPDEYCKFDGTIVVTVTKKKENNTYKIDNVSYVVKDSSNNDITNDSKDDVNVYLNEDGNIYVEVKNYQEDGKYDLVLVKQDENGEQLNSQATFQVNNETKEVTGRLVIAKDVPITVDNVTIADTYTIKELMPPDEYCKFDGTIIVTVTKKNENGVYKIDNVSYKVTDSDGNDITTASKDDVKVYLNEDGNIYVEVKNYQNDGKYNVVLVKEDKNGEELNSQATFKVNGKTEIVTGRLTIAKDVPITAENVTIADIYEIEETVAPDKYCKFNGKIVVTVTKKNENGTFKVDNISYKVFDLNGKDITEEAKDTVNVYLNENGNIYVEVKNYQFDLKLIKRIVEVNGVKVNERIEDIDITKLANGTETTADYDLNKNPVPVKNGDIVKYTLRIYNEGDIDGYASEITEDIPEGLELLWSEKTGSELEEDETLSEQEKEAIKYNQLIWEFKQVNTDTNKVELISTDYLAKGKGAELAGDDNANLIKAFDPSKEYTNLVNEKNPDYKEVSVYMKVVSEDITGTIIRNEAAITEDTDKEGNPVDDRDSEPEEWVKYEDDEDYDNVILKSFDLALRKFIIAVSKDTVIENDEYLKNSDGTYIRAPKVDTSKLNTTDESGKLITTATYNHTKVPVEVMKNDIVVYMLRVYNEGDIDGYATEITDHLPPYLEFVESSFNKEFKWEVSEDGRTVKTRYLDDSIIESAETNENGEIVLSYKEVPIMCKVTNKAKGIITNIADITEKKDENKEDIKDRDSEEDNVRLPDDEELPTYKEEETDDYVPGQQDDDDFEEVVVKIFDLALRKFITAVNDDAVTNRIPQVNYDEESEKITYNHTKEPVEVVTNNIVTYTIRVYNEGEINGYASKVSDDIPDGLEYLPDNELNKEYRWVMYDEDGNETDDVSKAIRITTDYLSKEQGEARMAEDEELTENPALLKAFDKTKEISETNPDYADVKVAFKVVEPNGSDKIIVNSAQISDDTDEEGNPVDDEDSTPDEWIDDEDDQDKEYIKLTCFDLALRKWVTHAIVIENGVETVTETGHKAEDDPEQVVKVELHRKKLSNVTVKFKYSIRVTNEGDIAGYAKEIKDHIPAGLKFLAEDNSDWVDEGNNVISTRKLENTLLQPGESAEVEVVLTWINSKDNLGLKVNIAEISEDDNDKGVPDRDSTPDNEKPEEDDQDDAPVLISVATGLSGIASIYLVLGFAVLVTVASGIVLIKRFVL